MDTDRIHRATSDDGTEIVGRVHGEGPPLVLVPGGPGDGERSFELLVPGLADRFTCHCMSTRGKGLSADAPDHAVERLVEDVRSFVESIGEPVALFGHSSGGMLALEAAARSDAVTSLAVYEPAIFENMGPDLAARLTEAGTAISRAVEAGDVSEASRIFFVELAMANDEELPALAAAGIFELVAPNVPAVLRQIEQSGVPRLSDPGVPQRITVPTLLLRGTRTAPFYADVVSDLAARLPDVRIVDVDGAGHLGPQLVAEPVADELVRFFASAYAGR